MTGKQILKKYQTHSVSSEIEMTRKGNPLVKRINNFEC